MRTPPFGKPLQQLLSKGVRPSNSIYFYVGYHAWDKGKMSSISRPERTLILPLEKSVLDYDWPVNECEILMIETSQLKTEYLENVAHVLLSEGADKVVLISLNLLPTIYKKDF